VSMYCMSQQDMEAGKTRMEEIMLNKQKEQVKRQETREKVRDAIHKMQADMFQNKMKTEWDISKKLSDTLGQQ